MWNPFRSKTITQQIAETTRALAALNQELQAKKQERKEIIEDTVGSDASLLYYVDPSSDRLEKVERAQYTEWLAQLQRLAGNFPDERSMNPDTRKAFNDLTKKIASVNAKTVEMDTVATRQIQKIDADIVAIDRKITKFTTILDDLQRQASQQAA